MKDLYIRSMSLKTPLPESSYLSQLPAVRQLTDGISFSRQVTFFVGENGSGKSTLIEALAVSQGFNPEGGTKNFCFHTNDTHAELWEFLRVARGVYRPRNGFFLRAESYYNLATNIDELDREPGFGPKIIDSYGSVSLHRQSHGESFLATVENRFGRQGLYILDEPEAALSPRGIIRLLRSMDRLVRQDSQFIISTHSPMLMAFPGAEIKEISRHGIQSVTLQETDHYRTTLRFLLDPEAAMEDVLHASDEEE